MGNVSRILKAIQHPKRREILYILCESPINVQYTELLPLVDGSTGKLNYHLKILDPYIIKSESGYDISESGEKLIKWLELNELISKRSSNFRPNIDRSIDGNVVINWLKPGSQLLTKYYILVSIFLSLLWFILLIPVIFNYTILRIYIWLITLVTFLIILFYIVNKYYNSIQYQITDTEVIVRKGIATQTTKYVPYRTITNLELKQGPIDRILNIFTIHIETAGNNSQSMGPEEKISGLIEGIEIKETILERIRLLNPLNSVSSENDRSIMSYDEMLLILKELKVINAGLNPSK